METKLYIRDGKRFKYVPNMLGMYWNGIILTKEKMQDSVAVVIEQHYDYVTMASLEISSPMNWFDAKEWCKINSLFEGRLPSKTELIILHKYVNNKFVWGEEYSDIRAWCLNWSSGGLSFGNKSYNHAVRTISVADVPILNLI